MPWMRPPKWDGEEACVAVIHEQISHGAALEQATYPPYLHEASHGITVGNPGNVTIHP